MSKFLVNKNYALHTSAVKIGFGDAILEISPAFFLKTHANGRDIVGQQHATLLGPTCWVRLHGTTTMLALVAYSL